MSNQLPYQLLIFDWDGTLEDSVGAITRSIHRVLSSAGLPAGSDEAILDATGLNFEEGLARLYPQRNTASLVQLCKQQPAAAQTIEEVTLFEQTAQILEKLTAQGYWLAIATGKSRQGLDETLQRHQLHEHFLVTRTADDARSKLHPEMLLSILDYTGVAAREALMIGDSTHDVLMAQAAVDCVAVSTGVHSVATLKHIEYALNYLGSVQDLLPWLSQRTSRER